MSKEDQRRHKPWLLNYDDHVPEYIDYPKITINDLLNNANEKYGERIFLSCQSEEFTYDFVFKKIHILAKKLESLGIKKGDRVAIILPNIPQFIIAYYAILAVGGIVVAMNHRSTSKEFEYLFSESDPCFAFCLESQVESIQSIIEAKPGFFLITTNIDDYTEFRERKTNHTNANKHNSKVPFLDVLLNGEDLPPTFNSKIVSPDDPAIFQFSGGTTGEPKAAVGLHRNIVANVIQFKIWCNLQAGEEVILAAIPLYHVYGMVLAMNLGIATGAKIVLISDPSDVDFILEQINQNKVTFYPGVPTMYHAITLHEKVISGKYDLHSIKACISGSFSLHPQIKEDFERITAGKLIEGYGLSEAPTATHCNPLNGLNKTGSIGMPLPDVDVRIVDIDLGEKIQPQGEIGEMIIQGPQIMDGYFGKPQETASTIRNGWLYTGDIARMDEDGYFYLVDRKKSLIKVNGLQVWPTEVEKVINAHPKVRECAIAGVPDKIHGERVIGWVVPKANTVLKLEMIVDWCRGQLSTYKLPSEIIQIDSIPRTGVGKILRRKLVAAYLENKEA